MPSLELPTVAMPDLDLAALRIPGYPRPQTAPDVTPYRLTGEQTAAIKLKVADALSGQGTPQFSRMSAGRTADGTILACGLVNTVDGMNQATRWRLFSGSGRVGPDGAFEFQVKGLALSKQNALAVFSACQDKGLV